MQDIDITEALDQGNKSIFTKLLMIAIPVIFVIAMVFIVKSNISGEKIDNFRIANLNSLHFTNNKIIKKTLQKYPFEEFFKQDEKSIAQYLKNNLSWLDEVKVQKIYPNKIVLSLSEYDIFGIFNEKFFVSPNGIIFSLPKGSISNDILLHLPQINGDEKYAKSIINNWFALKKVAKDNGFLLQSITKQEKNSLTLAFNGGLSIIILDENSVQSLEKALKFIQELPQTTLDTMKVVDARSSQGLSIK